MYSIVCTILCLESAGLLFLLDSITKYRHEVSFCSFLCLAIVVCGSKKRRSKWDQGAPGPHSVVQPSPLPTKTSIPEHSNTEPSVSAAVAAAKLNAMLEAKGKLLKVWCFVFLIEAHQDSYVNVIYISQPANPAIPSPSNTTSTSDQNQPMLSAEIEINDSESR